MAEANVMDISTLFNAILAVAQFIAIILGGWYFIGEMDKKVAILISQREAEHEINTKKFDAIEEQLKELNKTTMQIALQENRLNSVDDRVKELNQKLEALRELKLLPAPQHKKRLRSS